MLIKIEQQREKSSSQKKELISKIERFTQALQKGINFYTIQHLLLITASDILQIKKDIAMSLKVKKFVF